MSVDHLEELQADIDKLKLEGKLSDNEIFQGYLSDKKFALPEDFPNAKSIIVVAIPTKLMLVNFQLEGKNHEVMLPPGYYSTGLREETLQNVVLEEIIKEPGYKISRATRVHLKLLAVRSGLGKYGRNNLVYIDKMGSLLRLLAYFTDCQLKDDWTDVTMMEDCKECKICMSHCPNNCITEERFVINVGRCLSLFNEVEGEFPEWVSPQAHNALIGCMRCQMYCPANHEHVRLTGRLEDITEDETQRILGGKVDAKLLTSLSRKLRNFGPAGSKETFPVFTRNLRALMWARREDSSVIF